jgi:hypothetical protein
MPKVEAAATARLKSKDNLQTTKGKKRTASSSPVKVKKGSAVNEDQTEENKPTLKSSERLSCQGQPASLKLVSWNVNGIRGWLTHGGLKYLDEERADIVCFQVNIKACLDSC